MTTSEIATVLAWHDALNEQDFDTLVPCPATTSRSATPNGARQGHDALLDWARSSGVTADPGRMYVHDGVVVVEQRGHDGRGAPPRRRRSVSCVTTSRRCSGMPTCASALAATELTEKDLAG